MHVILNDVLRFVFEAEYHTENKIKAVYANLRIGPPSKSIGCQTTFSLDDAHQVEIFIFAPTVDILLVKKTFHPIDKTHITTDVRRIYLCTDRRDINCVLDGAIANAIDYYAKRC